MKTSEDQLVAVSSMEESGKLSPNWAALLYYFTSLKVSMMYVFVGLGTKLLLWSTRLRSLSSTEIFK